MNDQPDQKLVDARDRIAKVIEFALANWPRNQVEHNEAIESVGSAILSALEPITGNRPGLQDKEWAGRIVDQIRF